MSSKIVHDFNLDFDRVIAAANAGLLPKPKLKYYRSPYYGTSLSGEGMGIYDGRKLVAKLPDGKK